MEVREYKTLYQLEDSHWWFKVVREVLLRTCHQLKLNLQSRILDAGCGTGGNLHALKMEITPQAYGFDLSADAARYWPGRSLQKQVCVGSANAVPFQDNAFDAVVSVDLLECDAVQEQKAYQEMLRVIRPGGYLVLVVPAYQWLLSPEHHRAVQASRRYTRRSLARLVRSNSARLVKLSHLFMTIFPAIALYRISRRLKGFPQNREAHSELKQPPQLLNEFLFRLSSWEKRLVGSVGLPWGSSLLAIIQKGPA